MLLVVDGCMNDALKGLGQHHIYNKNSTDSNDTYRDGLLPFESSNVTGTMSTTLMLMRREGD